MSGSALLPRSDRFANHRSLAMVVIVAPLIGTLVALWRAWEQGGVSALALWLFLAFYLAGAIGIEIGYHRYFSHRAFKCGPTLRLVLGLCGAMSGQGPVLFWTAIHRNHHASSDTEHDPHGPSDTGLAAFWRAHVGWMFEPQVSDIGAKVPDLIRDRTTVLVHRFYFPALLAGLALPALIGFAFAGPSGALDGLLWGGFVRLHVSQQATWGVNSFCHAFGSRPYDTRDRSRNFPPLVPLTLGGAWHNNHHAFPGSAVNDVRWWQLDPSAWLIRLGARLGLLWDVRGPSGRFLSDGARHDGA